MVLLVLAVVWGLVLFSWIRTRFRAGFADPVSTFHRNLSVLERAGPLRPPAGRLTVPAGVAY
ncbi:MAG: hypothetical protein J2P58_10480, partial [Acidimicrobiaceae bacterium]|nr:hypothetical protein [Acidimicrobiaceae bacterium]